jgi:uroporphyrin-III C-methyltransferase/precorrin-2 dehydrogenase/sirohydrochlorin ferrochelatase
MADRRRREVADVDGGADRALAALVEKAVAAGLDPQTPALAVARATRPDQQVIAAQISELPAKLAEADLPGPVLVILGRVTGAVRVLSAPAGCRAA